MRSKPLFPALAVSLLLTVVSAAVLVSLYIHESRDPRWRVFDFTSRQATEAEIYGVADVPSIRSVTLSGKRRLRFGFTPPVRTKSWKTVAAGDGRVVAQGPHPEIVFGDTASNETYTFIPEDVHIPGEIKVLVSFFPKKGYSDAGLSWPDNYYTPYSSVHFTTRRPHSVDKWSGLPDDDPDVAEARRILEGHVDMDAPVLARAEQVLRFTMHELRNSDGIPSDEVSDASPLETYRLLSSGRGKGFCENRALVYYLFANAAGVKTRLVDIAGKFGPLKLTGHYFCESWLPEQASWFMVDPLFGVAHVSNPNGRLLHTLDIKKLYDTDTYTGCSALMYDAAGDSLAVRSADRFFAASKGYYNDIVMAYKFGYPRNRSYTHLEHFFRYPTLLYASFPLPRLFLVKTFPLAGLATGLAFSCLFGVLAATRRKNTRSQRS